MDRFVFMAALALMCMTSCSEIGDYVRVADKETVSLKVSVPAAMTKATGVAEASEKVVENLQVFVFDENGFLEASGSEDDAMSVKLTCKVGMKDVVAIANAPAIADVYTLAQLQDKVTYFEDNGPGRFIMTGADRMDVISAESSVTVDVARRVARVCLVSVKNGFNSPAYRDMRFRIEGVYMINASGSTGYFKEFSPVKWYNPGACDRTGENMKVRSLLNDETVGEDVAWNSTYTVPHTFYCYPNSGTSDTENAGNGKCTKLVVEASLDGTLYYYSVAIGNILPNHRYNVTIDVTRPGSSDPNVPVSLHEAAIKVDVLDWEAGYDMDITI